MRVNVTPANDPHHDDDDDDVTFYDDDDHVVCAKWNVGRAK